jgi:hypothetical protein
MVLGSRKYEFDTNSLAECFGVKPGQVVRWVQLGLLKVAPGGCFTVDAIVRFVREHPDAYDLRYVDQTWFKFLLTGGLRPNA